jgi:hypothetical protein
MLFVSVPFWEEPELVAAVVEPLAPTWRQVFAFILWIDKKIGVPGENDLYQSSAILRQDNQFDPVIG